MSEPVDQAIQMFADAGMLDEPGSSAVIISRGRPCKCGPGFCANDRGVGYYGFCAGSRATGAPDCPLCSAPHQSSDGCWLCSTKGGNNPEGAAEWLRCLRHDLPAPEVFGAQDAAMADGGFLTFGEAVDVALEQRAARAKAGGPGATGS